MIPLPYVESVPQLVARARAHRFSVTATQLARWHRSGLLLRPKQVSLGRGRGTQTMYPMGTGDQLVTLCRIRKRKRQLRFAGWKLWWEGFSVAPIHSRGRLAETAGVMDRFVGLASSDDEVPSAKAVNAIDRWTKKNLRTKSRLFGRLRNRIGRKNMPGLGYTLIEVAIGSFSELAFADAPDTDAQRNREVLSKAFGIRARDRAKRARDESSTGEANPVGEFIEMLARISRRFRKRGFLEALKATPDSELVRARDEFWRLLAVFAGIANVIELTGRKASSKYRLIRFIAKNMNEEEHAFFFLLWLWVRQIPSVRDGVAPLLMPSPPILDTGVGRVA